MSPEDMVVLGAGLAALALCLVLTPVWMRLAAKVGAIDWPRGRHKHSKPTPTAGGVAIFASAWIAAIAFAGWTPNSPLAGILIASGLLVLLNLYDDTHGLPPLGRLAAQVALAAVAYQWGIRIEGVGNLSGLLGPSTWVELGWTSAPVTILWIVFVTNALNWLDGIDGLAAGVAAICAATFAVMAGLSPVATTAGAIAILSAAMSGASLGFLRYNFSPARIFMGDTGAMFLGFTLGCLSVLGAFKAPTLATVFLPILVLGVPLYDSVTAISKRLLAGKNPLVGDRTHIHYRLMDRGLSVPQTALVIYGLTAILCLIALWVWWK